MSRRTTAILSAVGCSALALFFVSISEVPPRLLYNPSPSAPTGFYKVRLPADLRVGDMVAAAVPEPLRSLAVRRGYLSKQTPGVKRIVGVAGDHVCYRDGTVYLNSAPLVKSMIADSRARPMPVWTDCRVLAEGEFFLAMPDVPTSLDSRYFGPVTSDSLLGRLEPLMTSTARSGRGPDHGR